jgi:hypothetical protein
VTRNAMDSLATASFVASGTVRDIFIAPLMSRRAPAIWTRASSSHNGGPRSR